MSFIVQPLDKRRLRVRFEYDVFSLEKMYVQIPLIVFFNSKVFVDGKSLGGDKVEKVVREVRLENPTMGSKLRITVPDGREAASIFPPVKTGRSLNFIRHTVSTALENNPAEKANSLYSTSR